MAQCECGCGQHVTGKPNSRTGQPIRFKKGHWTRLHHRRVWEERAGRLLAAWPDKGEMVQLLQEHGSAAAVGRHLGRAESLVKRMIRKYGLTYTPHVAGMAPSNMRFGWEAEDYACTLLVGAESMRSPHRGEAPYDLLWHGQRVNVKAARPSLAGREPQQLGWCFHVGRGKGDCDLYFLIAYSAGGEPQALFLVPADEAPKSQVRIPISLRSKWMRYEYRAQASD